MMMTFFQELTATLGGGRRLIAASACWVAVVVACAPPEPEQGNADAGTLDAAAPPVLVGLDVISRDGAALFEGRRLGLVVHGASRGGPEGAHAISVLRDRGYAVERLFSPEHGLDGAAEAGEQVTDGVDADSGLEVVSLYGERTAPQPEHLADLDVLVIDLQDAGVRFYTYASTMLLSVQAGLDAGLDVVILDRPNPLGGETTSGPFRDPDATFSLVSLAPGPLVHGLTLGELALVAFPQGRAHSVESAGRLYVVPMEGWRRAGRWPDTQRAWHDPSPNLRSPEAALLYPAIALLEATNVSEGRGTDAPFQLIGAPWWSDPLISDLTELFAAHGVEATRVEFVPAASAAAREPKYLNERCVGLRLQPRDGGLVHYELGVALLQRLAADPNFAFRREGQALGWLLGSDSLFDALAEDRVDQHLSAVRAANDGWRSTREAVLLYD